MGAGIALNLAIRHPARVKGLVLISPGLAGEAKPGQPEVFLPFWHATCGRWGAEEGLKQFRRSTDYSAMQQENLQAVKMLEEAFMQPGVAERAIRYEKMPADVPNREPQGLGENYNPNPGDWLP